MKKKMELISVDFYKNQLLPECPWINVYVTGAETKSK